MDKTVRNLLLLVRVVVLVIVSFVMNPLYTLVRMNITVKLVLLAVLLAVVLVLLVIYLPEGIHLYYLATPLYILSDTLRGQSHFPDLAQDIVGFRALIYHQDPYPILGPALKTFGLDPYILHASTHPPTAYLLVAPVAFLPWPLASSLWAWLMVAGIIMAFRAYGLSWKASIGVGLISLLWPPVIWSLSQITVIWLLGAALAYRFRNDHPFLAGICIAIASMTKFMPALFIIPFMLRRKWSAVAGFLVFWAVMLVAILALWPSLIARYIESSQVAVPYNVSRDDNGSFLTVPFGLMGPAGIVIVAPVILSVLWAIHKVWRDDLKVWDLISYLSVALLPIAWIYSLLPLLPGFVLRKDKALWVLMLVPIVAPPFGELSRNFVFATIALYGVIVALGTLAPKSPLATIT